MEALEAVALPVVHFVAALTWQPANSALVANGFDSRQTPRERHASACDSASIDLFTTALGTLQPTCARQDLVL